MKRYLFIDRDGTLIHEPADFQIDAYDKLALVDGVIPALRKLQDAGYRLVICDPVAAATAPGAPSEPNARLKRGPERSSTIPVTAAGAAATASLAAFPFQAQRTLLSRCYPARC